jgi:hypothetical protein
MDCDETGSKHTGTFIQDRWDSTWINNNKPQGRAEIQGGLGSWQWLPALFTRDIANCSHDSAPHDYLFHPVIIGNLVQKDYVSRGYERSTEMVSIDTVNQADVCRKSRSDVTRRSDRNFSCLGTTGT